MNNMIYITSNGEESLRLDMSKVSLISREGLKLNLIVDGCLFNIWYDNKEDLDQSYSEFKQAMINYQEVKK